MNKRLPLALLASTCLAAFGAGTHVSQAAGEIKIVADDIGGVVTSAKGPEAGVWVIAETKDTQIPLTKIVVTDDKGQYVLPGLPKATFRVWVRGYGLVDGKPVDATPGNRLDLTAIVAPDGRAAAQVYPAEYWFAMAKIPKGDLSADEVMLTIKECLNCHQLGDKATREIPTETQHLGTFKTSLDLWDRRTKSGPAGITMTGLYQALGGQRSLFSDWTDRIANGEYPKKAPPRPSGVERNIVLTEWNWANPTSYLHDVAASDIRDPTINAYGRVYGTGQYDDVINWVDPIKNEGGQIKVPSTGSKSGWTKDGSMFATSPFWGDEKVWLAAAQPRSSAIDQKGRAWFAARAGNDPQASFCKPESGNKFAQYYHVTRFGKGMAYYDPAIDKVEEIETCQQVDHNQFALPKLFPGNVVFFGQDDSIGWIDTGLWDKTHSAEMSEGWLPSVIDTSGDGKISRGWTEPNDPIDPARDHRIHSTCYSIAVSPADGSVWCSGVGPGTHKVTRYFLGSNPPETSYAEQYEPPKTLNGVIVSSEGGVDIDNEGVVWQGWRGTDQVTAFDRRKCKVLNGPKAATGTHCPEGWTSYRWQQPTLAGGTKINANMLYLTEVDREGVLGLGEGAVMEESSNVDGIEVLQPKTGKWTKISIPYPMSFMTRSINARIDDPKAGWKGRGLWTSFSNVGIWHMEGGKGQTPRLIHIQLRPDPLAN